MGRKPAKPGPITRIVLFIRGTFGLNIATAVTGIILTGVLVSLAFYMATPKIESYQVTSGPLSRNETFTGLAIHEENIVSADGSGYVQYYAREGTKINANGVVLGISSSRQTETETTVSQEDLAKIREEMMSFSKSFSSSSYIGTYSFKYQVEGSILQYSGVNEDDTTPDAVTAYDLTDENGNFQPLTESSDESVYAGQTLNKAESDGIVLYSKDNYTGKTVEDLTAEDFQQNSYHEVDLKTSDMVSGGQDVYTLITDERWSLLIPLSDRKAARLADRTVMRVKFLKDDMTQTGDFEIIEIDGSKYGKIDFNKGLVRYAADRFLEVELVTNTVSGLRIPLTSIVTKDFYVIPDAYAYRDYSGTTNEFHLATGNVEDSVIDARVYASVADEIHRGIDEEEEIPQTYTLFVEKSAFQEGDVLLSSDGSSQYTIGETESLEGVYCINQGYAVFCRIEVLDQNEEYAVISRYTSYGVSKYDRIVRNADKVKEEDILY